MTGTDHHRHNRVFKSLHKPLTYLGVERTLFFSITVSAVAVFNLFESLLAGVVVSLRGYAPGRWATTAAPAMLRIVAKSEHFRSRYDAAQKEVRAVEVR